MVFILFLIVWFACQIVKSICEIGIFVEVLYVYLIWLLFILQLIF